MHESPSVAAAPSQDVEPSHIRGAARRARRTSSADRARDDGPAARRKTIISIVDQGIVSAGNFFTTLMLGRVAGARELGVYSLGFTLVLMIVGVQTALVTIPYTIYGQRLGGHARREYAGNALAHYALLVPVAMTALGVAALVGRLASHGGAPLPPVLATLAATVPFLLLRDFVRRFALAHFRLRTAVAVDASVVALQVAGIAALALTGRLGAVGANLVIGGATLAAAGAALARMRGDFALRRAAVPIALRRNWILGRWIVLSQLALTSQTYAVHWLLAGFRGPAVTGVFAASMTVLLLANPLVLGIGNLLEPRAARAFADGGTDGLARDIRATTALLATVLGLYCSFAILAGGPLVAWAYHGGAYAHQGPTVAVLALAVFVGSLDLGAAHALRVIERARLNFLAAGLALATTLGVGLLLVPHWGTIGGAAALLAGNAVGVAVRWIAFARATRQPVILPS